jgi:hypothetical protein
VSFTVEAHTISGKVTEGPLPQQGAPIQGVTVTLTINSVNTTSVTDGTGSFSFPNIPSGVDYSLSAAKVGFVFHPASQGGFNIDGDRTHFFTGTATASNSFQFTAGTVNATEGAGSFTLTVTRTGDSSASATVDYATSDAAATQNCNVTNGAASQRCDYIIKLGTLRFAAGETSKNISILLVDDVRAEGTETFTVTLTNPVGATLGSPSVATLTIADNETVNGSNNPINGTTFFVRQHYLDFLNREPDAGGLGFWSNDIESCGSDAGCRELKRINVSAAFFFSIEFQETGYLVYRIYKSAFGNLSGSPVPVSFTNFVRDTQEIGDGVQVGIGDWQARLEANKQAFTRAIVQSSNFKTAFPDSFTATQIVDKLNANAGNALSDSERATLIGMLTTPSDIVQRANVLRSVADDQTLKDAEFNKAFVLMQYFGYLRRNPNDVGFDGNPDPNFNGFNFWLDKLNQFNGNFVQAEMVRAFILSIEYGQRFAP